MIVVNHTYQEIGLFPKQIVSGGTGVVYSADNIWILGRQQEKDGSDIIGYNFIINVEKSRYVKEKSKIPITVNFQGGMSKWSGLIDIALESGHVFKPTNGWYSRKGEEKKHRLADTDTKEFWMPILKDKTFQDYIETKYKLAGGNLMQSAMSDDDISEEFENADSV
jgi:hypothetical protein